MSVACDVNDICEMFRKNSFFLGGGGGEPPWPLAPTGLLPGDIWWSRKKTEDNWPPGGDLETASKTWSLQAKSGFLATMLFYALRQVNIDKLQIG